MEWLLHTHSLAQPAYPSASDGMPLLALRWATSTHTHTGTIVDTLFNEQDAYNKKTITDADLDLAMTRLFTYRLHDYSKITYSI